jgi:hypothetical protein
MPSRVRALVAVGLAMAAAGAPRSASAGDFAEDGTFLVDPDATVSFGFEPDEVPDATTTTSETALEGEHVLALGAFGGLGVRVSLPAEARHWKASAWVRGAESVVEVEVVYGDPAPGVDSITQLFPTGRMTSDGWMELAADVRIDGRSSPDVRFGIFSAGTAELDAFEMVPGDPLSPSEMAVGEGTTGLGSACDGAADGSDCPPGATCQYGVCTDVSGWVPEIPANRDEVADYLAARLEIIFGPFENRELDLPHARVALEQMKVATDRWSYWNAFGTAVRRLHDGHTGTGVIADFWLRNQRGMAICFLEGDADLTHAAAPRDPEYLDVLVSHVGVDRNMGLSRGDRLVSVDGQHPIAWARSLIGIHWSLGAVSNHETFAELAEQLRGLIGRYARTIEVIRCRPAEGEEPTSCGDVELLVLDEVAPLNGADEEYDFQACDNRPLRHLAASPSNHVSEQDVYGGMLLGTDPLERLYGLEWESLYTSNGVDGVGGPFNDWIATWERQHARGVVLDHRSGNGGTLFAPSILWDYFVQRHPSDAYVDRQRVEDERPTLEEGQAIFEAARQKGLVNYAGSEAPQGADVKVALLITRDVSASDWLALGFKGSPNARIFGPFETNGAFSTRFTLGYWLGLRYTVASGDTFVPSGETLNGHGVEPDVVVLPLQSDLVEGRDTVFDAALAWLREEVAP